MQEKEAAITDDLGRDLNSVLALIRRHEGFENDLVALEAQLQVLVEDAARLQTMYPGHNAVHIDDQQKIVVTNWEDLKERSAHRRDQLQASCDLQRFLTQVRCCWVYKRFHMIFSYVCRDGYCWLKFQDCPVEYKLSSKLVWTVNFSRDFYECEEFYKRREIFSVIFFTSIFICQVRFFNTLLYMKLSKKNFFLQFLSSSGEDMGNIEN